MPHKILIVEDEAATSLDLEQRLTGWGYTTLGPLSRGERVLAAVAAEQPDLALMDIQLAGEMDGIATAAELKARWGIPVVYLSAFASDPILKRAEATSPLGYVVKPFTELELQATVRMAIAKLEVDRQLHAREVELEQFKTTLDSTSEAVFMFRPDTLQYFYVNQAACQQVGYRRSELLAMHAYDLKPEFDEAKFRELLAPLQERLETSVRMETLHRRKDGTDLPVDLFLQLVAPPGEPARFVNICTDITERLEARRHAQMQLRRARRSAEASLTRLRLESMASDVGATLNSGKDLAAMLQGCADTITNYLDVALVRVWTLGASEQVLELQASAGHGQPPIALHRHVPVGQDDIGRIAKDRVRIFARPVDSDPRAIDPDWVRREKVSAFAGYPLLVERELVGVLAVYARDDPSPEVQRALDRVAGQVATGIHRKWLQAAAERTAAQKIADEHENLERVLDGSEDAVLIQNERMEVLFANRAARKLFGKRVEEGQVMDHVLLAGEDHELDVLQPDGTHTVVELRTGPAQWLGVPARIVTFRDVTDRNLAAQHLERARDTAIRARDLQAQFLAHISHELRTPLTSMRGFTQTLLADPEAPVEIRQEFLGLVQRESMHLSRLVNDLLDLSSLESGHSQFQDESVDLGRIASECLQSIEPQAESKSLRLESDFAPSLPRFVGDLTRMRSVVQNLLSNAVKYTPPGGWVRLSVATRDRGVVLEVTDSGVGIPAAEHAKIFEKFHRVRRRGNAEVGTGLGLPIVKAIVEHYGGLITVESQEGQGSCFRVWLPLRSTVKPEDTK